MAAAGFLALAAMLTVEGFAIIGTYSSEFRYREPSTLMMTMHFRPR